MESRKRLINALTGDKTDRVPLTEICFWPETIKRWEKEGLPEGVSPLDFLGMDKIHISCPFDCSLMLPETIIEETDDYIIKRNSDGVTVKSWKNSYAPPSEVDFLIKTRDDWHKVRESFLNTERFIEDRLRMYEIAKKERIFLTANPCEPIWYLLTTLGFERALSAMVSESELIEEIISDYTSFILKMLNISWERGIRYDALFLFSDLCYKNGMLFSPRTYKERFMQYHHLIKKYCNEHNMYLIIHCDGNIKELLPLLIEVGFDCIQPLEARAGNDVRDLIEEYRDAITFFGNINMDVLSRGNKDEIEEEVLTKIEAGKKYGKYIFHSDHSVPPTVSFDSYIQACEIAKKYGVY